MTRWALARELDGLLSPNLVKVLAGFKLQTVFDLLTFYPRRYYTRGRLTDFTELEEGLEVTVHGEVVSADSFKSSRATVVTRVVITDGCRELSLTFFNQPWRADQLRPGRRGLFAGKISRFKKERRLSHPDYVLFDEDPTAGQAKDWAETILPVYRARASFPSWKMAPVITGMLERLSGQDIDPVPSVVVRELGLMELKSAFWGVHKPENSDNLARAQRTLRFFEAFMLQVALYQHKLMRKKIRTRAFGFVENGWQAQLDACLPFTLTPGQQEASEEIYADLAKEEPMNRILQGEVGCGKTVVALRAMLRVADGGAQAALLVPTEVLARQHYATMLKLLGPRLGADLRPTLLAGSMGPEARRSILGVTSGKSRLVVGTHALFSRQVSFDDLALVIIDEQQRFGVKQRKALLDRNSRALPHLLMLSATPIPRTVALSLLRYVDLSTIKTTPKNRAEVETHVVPLAEKPHWLFEVFRRMGQEIEAGRQVFVVAPVISKSKLELVGVRDLMDRLRAAPQMKGARISALHGQLSAAQRDQAMADFALGQSDVLVATTMVEVGVDVPNASMMVVTAADRFGVSQLHQLRGRIGRGDLPGVCLLLTHAPADSPARRRLAAVAGNRDGFVLAEWDLQLRKEGDLLGQEQSGRGRKLLRLGVDQQLIIEAQKACEAVHENDPELSELPLLRLALSEMSGIGDIDELLSA